ncbi:MAG: threonine/serine exporter family protein [Flammeovirgaceae bacterium]|nr:threonine/serine exporter family protein [Flammeovirgaceae bacterium]
MTASNSKSDLTELGQTLLSIGTLLMSSGANCQRITKTLERLAGAFNCTVDLLITHKALMVTINAHGVEYFHSGLKRTLPHR